MNVRSVKKPEQRVDTRYISALGLKSYGADNLYPQHVGDIIDASPTGSECLDRYARFIEGNGFADTSFAAAVVNAAGETADDVCQEAAADLARYGGFALHVNYNVLGDIVSVQCVPFETLRLAEDDDAGYIGKAFYHPDWRGRRTRNGKVMRVDTGSVRVFPLFTPRRDVVLAQIAAAGGIQNYRGQIMYVNTTRGCVYPRPKYDSAITELSTDEGLSNVKFRNVRNNFLTAAILYSRRSMSMDGEHGAWMGSGYSDELAAFQGDETSLNILEIELDVDEERPELVEFPTKNFDKDFTATETSVVERIYSVFEQEPFLAIRNGRLGFSGDVIQDAYNYYSAICGKERRVIERAFTAVVSRWHEPNTWRCDIEPLVFSTEETTTINDTIVEQ